jgi:hypothetical protein
MDFTDPNSEFYDPFAADPNTDTLTQNIVDSGNSGTPPATSGTGTSMYPDAAAAAQSSPTAGASAGDLSWITGLTSAATNLGTAAGTVSKAIGIPIGGTNNPAQVPTTAAAAAAAAKPASSNTTYLLLAGAAIVAFFLLRKR